MLIEIMDIIRLSDIVQIRFCRFVDWKWLKVEVFNIGNCLMISDHVLQAVFQIILIEN